MASEGTWEIITGNHAAAIAAKLARVKVVPAYPITPQTTIVEYIASFIESGQMDAEYIRVESEHSAMAAAIGASAAGVRAFTATASQGLLLMSEVLHWAAGSRLPIGMAVVNRAVGPPWNIHVDHQDAISQRDTGWIQLFISSNQEVLDTILMMYKVAENPDVLLPFMVCLDGFVLSHTYMPVNIPDQELVDEFLPPYEPPHWRLDPEDPITFGNLTLPDEYQEMRWSMDLSMRRALDLIEDVAEEFFQKFGRYHGGATWKYRVQDAEYVVVAAGTMASEAEVAVDRLRDEGIKVGLLKIRALRPFPHRDVAESLQDRRGVVIIDRSIAFSSGGPLGIEIRSSLYDSLGRPPTVNYITGLGGRDVTYHDIMAMVKDGIGKITSGRVRRPYYWFKLKPEYQKIELSGEVSI